MPQQLLLFEETREERLAKEIERLKEQCDKMRKGHFVRYNALTKIINELKSDLDILNANICKKPSQTSFF